MKKIIFLGGLCRSGNTLLASIFMQHPKIAVTAHSNLFNILYQLDCIKNGSFHKNFPDDKSIDNVLNTVFEKYYSHWKKDVIIDRSPSGTLGNLKLIKKYIKPDKIKFIFLKRPFKEILGSFYKLGGVYKNIDHLMNPNQMIQFDYQSVGTVLQDKSIDKLIIEYDDLVNQTQNVVDKICSYCGEKTFKIDFKNIKQLNIEGVSYDDKYVEAPLHKIRTDKIEKLKYNYDDIIPNDVYEKYKHLDQVWEKTPNFNFIDKIHFTSEIKKYITNFMKDDWNKYDYRQKTFDVHKDTKTIPIIYDEDFDKEVKKKHAHYTSFINLLSEIETKLLQRHEKGNIIRAILVNLPKNCSIKPHIDKGKSLENTLRYHLPIITNDKVTFTVGGEAKNLKESLLWEIKNTDKIHSVENNGDTDRIHFIIDWKINK